MLFITKIFFKVNKLYMLTVCNNTSKKTYDYYRGNSAFF